MELSEKETELFKLLINEYVHDKYDSLYQNKSTDFDFILNFNFDKIPFNLCVNLNQKIFNSDEWDNDQKLISVLIFNSVLYALKYNKKEFIKYIKNKDNIQDSVINEPFFGAKLTDYAMRFIYLKKNNNIDLNEYKNLVLKSKDIIKENNIIKASTITDIYRNIMFTICYLYRDTNAPELIDTILNTSTFDDEILLYGKGVIKNKNDILLFKNCIAKLILSDAFIKACSIRYDYDADEEEFEDEQTDDYETDEITVANKVYNYIIDLENLVLPDDENLKYNIYYLFFDLNGDDKTYDFSNFEINNDNVKKLKKINPIYFLDKISDK